MIRFEHASVTNWHNANRGMRNSWESWGEIDSYYVDPDGTTHETPGRGSTWVYGPNDLALAARLAKAGADHGKFLRQIYVDLDLIAGNEFWKEYDTYKVGTVANSTSMMHTMGKRLLTMDDFSFDDPNDTDNVEAIERINALIERWWAEGRKKRTATWRKLMKLTPMGFVYRRTCSLNYQVLRNMYHARKAHRLEEWREFCRWIETLPYASELIVGKRKEEA